MIRWLTVISSLLGALCMLPLPPERVRAQDAPIAVVVDAAFAASDISFADLRGCFRGRRVQLNGVTLIPFNLPTGNPLRQAFDRAVLGLEPEEVGRFWVDMRIRDQGSPPRTAPTSSLALRVVAALKGAISYARATELNRSVKALTVDGKAPGDRDYPLNLQ